jgi:hypothetical protein
MPKTLQFAFPILLRVFVGVLPFIIGSSFLAATLFWQSEEFFGTFPKTLWYVFSLQTGDGIFAVFD